MLSLLTVIPNITAELSECQSNQEKLSIFPFKYKIHWRFQALYRSWTTILSILFGVYCGITSDSLWNFTQSKHTLSPITGWEIAVGTKLYSIYPQLKKRVWVIFSYWCLCCYVNTSFVQHSRGGVFVELSQRLIVTLCLDPSSVRGCVVKDCVNTNTQEHTHSDTHMLTQRTSSSCWGVSSSLDDPFAPRTCLTGAQGPVGPDITPTATEKEEGGSPGTPHMLSFARGSMQYVTDDF